MKTAYAIIVAGGIGARMGSKTRKQYLSIDNTPIIIHTLRAVDAALSVTHIILVVPLDDIEFVERHILSGMCLSTPIQVTAGGKSRQASVYNGLLAVGDPESLVVIHDGVRPFITGEEIDRSVETAQKFGACIFAVPAHDTLKIVQSDKTITRTLERQHVWHAQTPQTFQYHLIKMAHEKAIREGFEGTDDAMLVERAGGIVKVLPSHHRNIKITSPEDLKMAEAIMKTAHQ